MTVRVTVDDDRFDAALRGLLDMGATLGRLEQVLVQQFAATDAQVHVDTGSLRASGEVDSDYAAGRWQGQVSYGGPSPGFENDPVDYAGYERARGGLHDFMAPAFAIGRRYRAAVRAHFEGRPG